MDGGRSDGRLSACIEGAVLLVMLGALGLGLLAVHTEGTAEDVRSLSAEESEPAPEGQLRVVGRAPVHMVILVDVGEPMASAGEFSRSFDAGMGWVASLEVIEATDSALRGLAEAKTTCAAGACRELVVLDLRVASS
jgi:hypothetical protein